MFKTETHLHTSEVSRCAHLGGEEMVRRYLLAGYHTIFVTDHFKDGYFASEGDLSWEEQVDRVLRGYDAAKAAGDALGLVVLPGVEVALNASPNHYLMYGITREKLLLAPHLFDMQPRELHAFCREQGITLVQAHPYRDGVCIPTPDAVDAMEVINTNPRHKNFDKESIACAREWGLPMTSGSDAHRDGDVGLGGVVTEERITRVEDYVSALLSGSLMRMGETQ